jgi:peptide/nickel transport system substrate-binding protein
MFSKKLMIALGLLIVASIVLAACAQPTPETITETVVETVVVTEVVEKEGETVIETVIVTVEPEMPVEEPMDEGPRTLVICQGQEPDTLYQYGGSMVAQTHVIEGLRDGPIDNNSFGYQAVILEKLPSLADGDAVIQQVTVTAGDTVINAIGEIVELAEGVTYRPAGCTSVDCEVAYEGGDVEMDQIQATFKILPSVNWSDGTPLTARDSVYSFELAMDPDTPTPSRYTGERTAAYEAVDDKTVSWTGLPGFMDAEYFVNFFIPEPEHVLGQYTAAEVVESEEASRLPLGWGAYIIDEWVQGDHITMSKNPNYWRADEGLPYFDTVVYRMVGENSNANVAAVLSGECDIVDQTSHLDDQSELLLELQGAGQLNATFVTGTVWEHADFNIQPVGEGYFAAWDTDGDGMGPFGDVRLRQAVAMCMDRQAVVDTVMFGQSVVLHTYLPPQHPLFNADVTQWPFDIEAGSALLEEIGWLDDDGDPLTPRIASGVLGVPDGTPLEFQYETTSATQRMQATQVMAESAAQCGIKMNLNYFPASEWFADGPEGKLFGRRTDLGQFAWLTGVAPPCDLYLGGAQIPSDENGWSGQNQTGWDDAEYNQVCNAALGTLPGQEGYEEFNAEAQSIFADNLPVVPLYLRLKLAATRPDMCNFIMDPTANSEMWNIEEFDFGACAE